MPNVSLVCALLGVSLAAQSPAPPRPAPPPAPFATTVQLMTVVDHVDLFGQRRVRIPNVAVKHLISARVAVVGNPRILGIDRSYQPHFRYDQLLVLLPAAVSLARDQVITVTGSVSTFASARATGLPIDEPAADKRARKMRWSDRTPVLVADSVETVDGTALAGTR